MGSYTQLTEVSAELSETYSPIAGVGELSPFSTTSVLWDKKWPNKPDVVFEGGNVGIDGSNFATVLDELSILTTDSNPQERLLSSIHATSASTAIASNFAATLSAEYPEMWPETLRGLIVHSAEWPKALWDQFSGNNRTPKQNRELMLRVNGYGVPNLQRARESASNSLTLIAQEEIQPFCQRDNSNEYRTNDMHLYELPWPREALRDLPGETPVKIDVTLSYFIEPGPGEIGWRDKYRYRSHGLHFDMKKPTETAEEFVTRLNKAAQNDPDGNYGGGSVPWDIGVQNGRTRGSVHRDWWQTNAAEAQQSNVIGIFPRSGWWKDRSHLRMGAKSTRYSLIVTLNVPSVDVDIYTPVSVQLAQRIAIPT